MTMFFKKKNDRPLNFSYIQERKQSPNYSGWIIGVVLLVVATLIIFIFLK